MTIAPLRIGVLGTAAIARAFFERPARHAEFVAVASRDPDRAGAFAAEHGIPHSYGTYDDLLRDPSVEAVYIPLPHHMHREYTVRAAECGKHVLVEKPAALTVDDVSAMRDACARAGVVYMEALMYRFKSIHRRVRDMVRDGRIGQVRYIDFSWCFPMALRPRGGFRLDPSRGGGVLYDLGVYGVDFVRFVTGEDPRLHSAAVVERGPTGIDIFTQFTCRTDAAFAGIVCGFTTDANWYGVSGELGSILVPGSVSGRLVDNVMAVHLFEGDRRTEEHFPVENPYVAELDAFAECVRTGSAPETDAENSICNIRMLEEVTRRTGVRV